MKKMVHKTGVGYFKDGYYCSEKLADGVAKAYGGTVHAVPGRKDRWYVMRPEGWAGELRGAAATFMDYGDFVRVVKSPLGPSENDGQK